MNIDACKKMWVASINLDTSREMSHENPEYATLCEFWLASFAEASQEWQESLDGHSADAIQIVSDRCRREAIEEIATNLTGMTA